MFEFDQPIAWTTFCDDIRQEVGGKLSYIGIYTGVMNVPSFPLALPKFAFSVHFIEPKQMAENRVEPIKVNIYLPGEELPTVSGEIPSIKDMPHPPRPSIDDDPGANQIVLGNAIFMIAPLLLQRPGRIRVRCEYPGDGGGLMRAGSLAVDLQAQTVTAATSPSQPSEQSLLAVAEVSSQPEPSRPARPTRRRRT